MSNKHNIIKEEYKSEKSKEKSKGDMASLPDLSGCSAFHLQKYSD